MPGDLVDHLCALHLEGDENGEHILLQGHNQGGGRRQTAPGTVNNGVRRCKRSAGTPPHFGTHGGWRLPLDIHSGCKYVVYGVRLGWKQGVPLPGCSI